MKIEILYFGRPSENLKISHESVQLDASTTTLGELQAWLRLRGELWAEELKETRVRCAINQEFAASSVPIKDGDEIAFFSPISGG